MCVCVCVLFWTVRFRAISALACLVSGSEGESKGENREANEIVSQEEIQEWSHRESQREKRGDDEIESQGGSQEWSHRENHKENHGENEIENHGGSQEWSHRENHRDNHRENRVEGEIQSQGESQELFSSADIRTLLEHLGKALDDNSHQSDGCSAVAIELGKC